MRALALLAVVAIGVPGFVIACGKTKSTRLSAQECDGVRAGAATAAQKAVESAAPPLYIAACSSHADCVEVPKPSCVVACNGYAAPKAARDSAAKSLREIEGASCKKWTDGDCESVSPMPMASCAALVPACKEGHCIMRDPRDVLTASECEALLAESRREVEAKVAAADRACKKDDDCTLTTGGCVSFCGGPAVAKTGESAYKAGYAIVAAKCKKWWDGDCMTTTPQAIPSCGRMEARCKGGLCVRQY